jgi:predicted DNA-binding transcriptional regulator YafY
VACVRLAQARLDPELASAAEQALHKIVSVLPAAMLERLLTLRQATEAWRKLNFDYLDLRGQPSQRTVRPLGCFYWDAVWTLADLLGLERG